MNNNLTFSQQEEIFMDPCPVCRQPRSAIPCPECGFDPSCGFETYPTLAPLPRRMDAVSRLKSSWQAEHCPGCTASDPAPQPKSSAVLPRFDYVLFGEIILQKDGTVCSSNPKYQTEDWHDIIAIACMNSHALGLCKDGTVVATDYYNRSKFDVKGWKNIVSIVTGYDFAAGLCSNGTVTVTGDNSFAQRKARRWHNITSIVAGDRFIAGLRSDGTVVSTRKEHQYAIRAWRNITSIYAGGQHLVGLRKDGTVVAIGNNRSWECNVDHWRDIQAIAAGANHTVGLRQDGTVISTPLARHNEDTWTDIIAIAAGSDFTVGLRRNGTVVVTGQHYLGLDSVNNWNNVQSIFVNRAGTSIQALCSDGTFLFTNQ